MAAPVRKETLKYFKMLEHAGKTPLPKEHREEVIEIYTTFAEFRHAHSEDENFVTELFDRSLSTIEEIAKLIGKEHAYSLFGTPEQHEALRHSAMNPPDYEGQ
jgi:hypothetical protein